MKPSTSSSASLPGSTLQTALERGRAGKAATLLTKAFGEPLQAIQDKRLPERLLQQCVAILQSDNQHGYGQRTVAAGNLSLLEGFEFCRKKPFGQVFPLAPEVVVDRVRGYCGVHFPAFCAGEVLRTLRPITHIRLSAVAAAIDFDHDHLVTHQYDSQPLALDALGPVHLFPQVPAGSQAIVVVGIGLRLLQVFNGTAYEMRDGGKAALQVTKVAKPDALKPVSVAPMQVLPEELLPTEGFCPKPRPKK